MSTEIEQRVVQMKFDNQQFESGTKTTLSTLDKLKQALKFENVQNGFSKISSAAKSVDMTSLGNATETVKVKFSALEVMAMTALSNITNSAVNAGKRLVSAFTIDPIKTGLQEYETQINAVQTILANTQNKGSTLDDVNNALAELNTYADKTIYNFTEMTRNIGTFTAAGVGLETSTKAIKGIANLAAISGSTAQQASTAMYQLSQAIAAGKVSLQDWNSVVNAGMGGEIFQEELKRTARNFGYDVDGMIAKYGSFRESLTEGAWLTTDVLTATLEKFTGDMTKEQLLAQGYTEDQANEILKLAETANDAATKVKTFTQLMDTLKEAAQSGWTQTWQLLIGDFEEAKTLFTSISDYLGNMLQKSADARNNLLQGWKDLGGREDLIAGLANIFKSLFNVLGAVKKGFTEVFPGPTAKQLAKFTKGFRELTEKLKPTENSLNAITNIFKGIASVLKVVVTALALPLKFIPTLITVFNTLGTVVVKIGGMFGYALSAILKFTSGGEFLNAVANLIVKALNFIVNGIHDFIKGVNVPMSIEAIEKMVPLFEKVKDKCLAAKDAVVEWGKNTIKEIEQTDLAAAKIKFTSILDKMKNKLNEVSSQVSDKMFNIRDSVGQGFGKAYDYISDVLNNIVTSVKNFINNTNWGKVLEFITGMIAGKFFLDFGSFLKNLGGAMKKLSENVSFFADIKDSVCDTIDGIKDSFEGYQKSLKADMLLKIGAAIAMIATSVFLLSKIKVNELIPALGAIGSLFIALSASMIVMNKFIDGGKGPRGILSLSAALLILSVAVKNLAGLDTKDMFIAIGAITTLMVTMGTYTAVMTKIGGRVTSSAIGLIAFAAALLILTSAVTKLTDIPGKKLAVALAGIIALSTSVAVSNRILGSGSQSQKGALKLVAFASAIKTLAKAVVILADLKWKQLLKGLTGVSALLAALTVFNRLIDDKRMISTATGMMILAGALVALTLPIKIFSMMQWSTFLDGLAKTAALLATLGVTLNLMPKNMMSISTGLLIASGALVVMGGALKIMASLSVGEMAKALITLGTSLVLLAVAMNAMKAALPGAAAMMISAGALVVLAQALEDMGEMTWGEIAKSLVTLAASLTILGVAMYALAPLAPVLLTISASVAIFAGGLVLLGAALVGISAGITALATALATSSGILGTFISAVGVMVGTALKMIVKMIPDMATAIGEAILNFTVYIGKAAPKLVESGSKIIIAMLQGMKKVIPELAETIVVILDKVLNTIADHIESIVEAMVRILLGVIKGISVHLPELIEATLDLLMNLFEGTFDALSKLDFQSVLKAIIGVGLMSGLLVVLGALAPLMPLAIKGVLMFSIVVTSLIGVLVLLGGLAQIPGVKWLLDEGADTLGKVGVAIGKFVGGIIGGVAEGVMSVLPKIGKYLSGFAKNAEPFFDLCNTVDLKAAEGVAVLTACVAAMTAEGLMNGIIKFFTGQSPLENFGKEIAAFAPYFKQYADTINGVDASVIEKTSNALIALAKFADLVPNKGGLVAMLTGDNTLTDFAMELVRFGPAFSEYSKSIEKVNAEAVEKSSIAAKSIAEFASLVPNKGGLVSLFTGDNTLTDFAKDLVKFGPAIAKYSDSVQNVNPEAVEKSANAAKMIIAFAEIVPNKGGLVSLFTGDNSLSSMAKDLTKFGPALAKYSESVKDVDLSSVRNSVTASKKIIELWELIPKEGSDLEDFSDQLKELGRGLKKYYDYIEDVEPESVNASVSCIKTVAKLFQDMNGITSESIDAFVEGVEKVGKTSIKKFTDAFANSGPSVDEAIAIFINGAINSLNNYAKNFTISGHALMDSLITSIESKRGAFQAAISTVVRGGLNTANAFDTDFNSAGISFVKNISNGISNSKSTLVSATSVIIRASMNMVLSYERDFNNAGKKLIEAIISGMNSKASSADNAVRSISAKLANAMNGGRGAFETVGRNFIIHFTNGLIDAAYGTYQHARNISGGVAYNLGSGYWSAYQNGAYLVQGFAQGIRDNSWQAVNAATATANAANRAFRNALRIESPSKVMMEAGKWFDLGFVKGVDKYTGQVENQSATMAERSIEALKEALAIVPNLLEEDMSLSPVITPVLDMTNIKKNPIDLDASFSARGAAQVSRLNAVIGNTANDVIEKGTTIYQNFEQNNYSPKALSAIEIYRNSKNLFSRIKK